MISFFYCIHLLLLSFTILILHSFLSLHSLFGFSSHLTTTAPPTTRPPLPTGAAHKKIPVALFPSIFSLFPLFPLLLSYITCSWPR
uniref:Uncharacterized protein n=1 Tax=Rhizophora mucronata TaxID=61149 RepID=A0A2P2KC28_RHIMU